MKFAIYGDSYADASFGFYDSNYNRYTWATMLAQKLGATHIDYHAASSSSFYHTYRTVQDSLCSNYDRIIVAVTEPTRYTRKLLATNGQYIHISGVNNLGILPSRTRSSLMGWFDSMDIDFMSTAQELMINHVLTMHPTAILVPCFNSSFSPARKAASGWCEFSLGVISNQARIVSGIDPTVPTEEVRGARGILCHLPAEWQAKIADMLYQHVTTGHEPYMPPDLKLRYGTENYYIRR